MFWQQKYFIFDDVVPVAVQNELENYLLGPTPWGFVADVTSSDELNDDKRPGFNHQLVDNGNIVTSKKNMAFLNQILNGVFSNLYKMSKEKGEYSVIQSRAFLQLPLNALSDKEYDNHHIDTFQKHISILYYVSNADGETVLFENMYSPKANPSPEDILSNRPDEEQLVEKARVMPKKGRVLVFDGYHWHTATQPTKGVRLVINTNIDQRA